MLLGVAQLVVEQRSPALLHLGVKGGRGGDLLRDPGLIGGAEQKDADHSGDRSNAGPDLAATAPYRPPLDRLRQLNASFAARLNEGIIDVAESPSARGA